MKTISDPDVLSAVSTFDRDFFDPRQRFKAIGSGGIGGKAHGLAVAQSLLASRFPHEKFRRIDVGIPSLTVLRTDIFDEFTSKNHLEEILSPDMADHEIARTVQRAELPVRILGDLRALVEQAHTPLAIRSSSLLEDDLSQPFAGVYQTKMIPNNQPSPDERFRRLTEAIKFVYASTFFRDAREYLAATGRAGQRDKMAVIIQEVVGTRFGDRFYPHISGVARSYNHYPSGHAKPKDGVASLALGLGKTIVEGGLCWTYSPAFPTAPAPFASPAAMAAGTQNRFWAVNMGKPPEYDPIRETEYLTHATLAEAEEDDTLSYLASTFDRESGRIRMGTGTIGPRVLDFAMLLTLHDIPVNDVVRTLLRIFEDDLDAPVEIEFAVSFQKPHRFGFLQVRPMMVSSEECEVSESQLGSERALIASKRALGNGEVDTITDIVYVRPETAAPLDTRSIAAQIDEINQSLLREGRPYLLIGFGRWGSSDPSLGIPVVWSQIAGAKVIVEAMKPEMNVELSQGSHFFHNLSSFKVFYVSVPITARSIDWDWLQLQPVVRETPLVRHVRTALPLQVKVDGRSGRGVVFKGLESGS